MRFRDFFKIGPRKSFLTAVDKETVQSSDGWKVSKIGNSPSTWKLRYSEREKYLDIGVEPGVGGARGYFLYVYLSNVNRWIGSDEFDPVSQGDRKRIGSNIRCAMKFRKEDCTII